MIDDYKYDVARLANFGRDVSRTHSAFSKATDRLKEEINSAIEQGISPTKIAHDVMGRCSNREAQIYLLSALEALVHTNKIPRSVLEPFDKGIHVRAV